LRPSLSNIAPYAAIALLGAIVYANSLANSFHYDDRLFIQDNPSIRDIRDLPAMWNFLPSRTRFVSLLSFALNYHFHKLDVLGYHLTNVAIHIGCGMLVFALIKLLGSLTGEPIDPKRRAPDHSSAMALAGALIFIAHPVQTQAVTYISQRMASLATFFYLSSVLFYLKGRLISKKNWTTYGYFTGCFLAAILSLLSKEFAISLPLGILAVEFYFLRPRGGYPVNAQKRPLSR